jgi:hypothetical protein
MVLAPIEVALYSVLRFTVFSLSYIILQIGAEVLERHTVLCCTHSSISTVLLTLECAVLHKQFAVLHQFPPTLSIIWAQVAEKHYFISRS